MTHNYAIVEGVPVIKLGEEKTDDENLSSRSTKDLNTLRSKISTEVSDKLRIIKNYLMFNLKWVLK
jgi:hypothetical protein